MIWSNLDVPTLIRAALLNQLDWLPREASPKGAKQSVVGFQGGLR